MQSHPRALSATIPERVVEFLEQAIIEGRLAPGQRITEEEIAERLAVSRSPVREAFRKLEALGLVTVIARKGVFVRPLDPEDCVELYTLQASVAGLTGRLAATRRTPAHLESLEAIVRGMAVAAEGKDPDKFLERYVEFTRVLTEAAGNEWIARATGAWGRAILRYGYFALSVPGYMEEALQRYQGVLKAIYAGDSAQAEAILHGSIELGGQRVAEFLRGRGSAARHEERA